MNLKVVPVRSLTPEELKVGINIFAEKLYQNRMECLANQDWMKAVHSLKNIHNSLPTDDKIRPVAERIYHERLERQALADWNRAIVIIASYGNYWTKEFLVKLTAEKIYQDRLKTEKEIDWLIAEHNAYETGYILMPV